MIHYLFSYGTLQKEKVQLSSFGRILKGNRDTLPRYQLHQLKITDENDNLISLCKLTNMVLPKRKIEN